MSVTKIASAALATLVCLAWLITWFTIEGNQRQADSLQVDQFAAKDLESKKWLDAILKANLTDSDRHPLSRDGSAVTTSAQETLTPEQQAAKEKAVKEAAELARKAWILRAILHQNEFIALIELKNTGDFIAVRQGDVLPDGSLLQAIENSKIRTHDSATGADKSFKLFNLD